ncbi:MAG: hypothetical protein AB1796_15140 [Bacillota bacterium]
MDDLMRELRANTFIPGLAMIIFGILVTGLAFIGHIYSMWMFSTLGILMLVAGILVFLARKENSLQSAGVKLVWSGWIALTMGVGGALLAPSSFYRLTGAVEAVMMVSFLIGAVVGLYTLILANRKTGIPLAP